MPWSPVGSGCLTGAFDAATKFNVKTDFRAGFPHAAVFLMTNQYVTGTVLEVTGGELLVDWIF